MQKISKTQYIKEKMKDIYKAWLYWPTLVNPSVCEAYHFTRTHTVSFFMLWPPHPLSLLTCGCVFEHVRLCLWVCKGCNDVEQSQLKVPVCEMARAQTAACLEWLMAQHRCALITRAHTRVWYADRRAPPFLSSSQLTLVSPQTSNKKMRATDDVPREL